MPSESTILDVAEISAQMLRMIPRVGADWGRDPEPIGRWLVSCRIATHGDPVWTAHETGGSDEPPTRLLTLTCDAPGPIAEIIARPAPSPSGAEEGYVRQVVEMLHDPNPFPTLGRGEIMRLLLELGVSTDAPTGECIDTKEGTE